MKQLTNIEVIDTVVEHYGKDPINLRSIFQGRCAYKDNYGNKCAVGMFIKDEKLKDIQNVGVYTLFQKESGRHIEDYLKTEVSHITDIEFWAQLQSLHDGKWYWDLNNKGLSRHGEIYVAKLKKDWK